MTASEGWSTYPLHLVGNYPRPAYPFPLTILGRILRRSGDGTSGANYGGEGESKRSGYLFNRAITRMLVKFRHAIATSGSSVSNVGVCGRPPVVALEVRIIKLNKILGDLAGKVANK